MKILLATSIYPPEIGGPSRYVANLCKNLSKKHEIVSVVYTNNAEAIGNTKLIKVSKSENILKRTLKYLLAINRESSKNDVILSLTTASLFPSAIISLLKDKPLVVKYLGDDTQKKILRNLVNKFIFHVSKLIIVETELYKNKLIQNYGLDVNKLKVIPNPAEESIVLPFNIKRIENQIFTVPTIGGTLDIETILKAFEIVIKTHPKTELIIANSIIKTENKKNIKILRRISDPEITKYLRESGIFILNPPKELNPHGITRTLAEGCLLIGTKTECINEIITDGKTGLLFDYGDYKELANKIIFALDNKHKRELMITDAQKLVADKFSWFTHSQDLEAELSSIFLKPIDIS